MLFITTRKLSTLLLPSRTWSAINVNFVVRILVSGKDLSHTWSHIQDWIHFCVTSVGRLLQVGSLCEHTIAPTQARSQMCVICVARRSTRLIIYAFTNEHIPVNVHTRVMSVERASLKCHPSPSTNVITPDSDRIIAISVVRTLWLELDWIATGKVMVYKTDSCVASTFWMYWHCLTGQCSVTAKNLLFSLKLNRGQHMWLLQKRGTCTYNCSFSFRIFYGVSL